MIDRKPNAVTVPGPSFTFRSGEEVAQPIGARDATPAAYTTNLSFEQIRRLLSDKPLRGRRNPARLPEH